MSVTPAAPGTTWGWKSIPVISWEGSHPILATDRFEESVTIVAQPGWLAVSCANSDQVEWWVWTCPIIAWTIRTSHTPVVERGSRTAWSRSTAADPILADGSSDECAALVCPDGRILDPLNGDYDTLDAWTDAAHKRWEEERGARANDA